MKKGITKKCSICEKSFYLRPSRLDRPYCSKFCYYKSLEKPKILKNCNFCKKEFLVWPSDVSKHCSISCVYKSRIKREIKNCKICNLEFNSLPSSNAHYCSKKCASVGISGDKNYKWKGDDVGYNGLHNWVRNKLGTPSRCESCGKTKGFFDWANISHLYKRDLSDWARLCRKCHISYDSAKLILI